MKDAHPYLLLLAQLLILNGRGGEPSLGTVYQPLDPMVDGSVVVREVPFVTSGAYPEVFFDSITAPHIPQQSSMANHVGDINVASRARLLVSCESATAGQTKLHIIFDFSKADPQLIDEALVKAVLECAKRTAGKSIGLYSRVVGAEKYPELKKLIEKTIPPQTETQRKADSGQK